jgi:hypothetical protein
MDDKIFASRHMSEAMSLNDTIDTRRGRYLRCG